MFKVFSHLMGFVFYRYDSYCSGDNCFGNGDGNGNGKTSGRSPDGFGPYNFGNGQLPTDKRFMGLFCKELE